MNNTVKVTATIVLYREDYAPLKKTIDSFLNTPISKKLFLIDNSPNQDLKNSFIHSEIEYIFVGNNIGFGKAHNLVLNKINSHYHLILNPDVSFNANVIPALIQKFNSSLDIAFITPKVTYQNKQLQYVSRKHPTFLDLLNRKVKFSKNQIKKNEYQDKDLEKEFFPDFIQGCFMFFKTKEFKQLQGFDERYFLYMEDADICRKVEKSGKKILYYPTETVIHQHQQGSSKSIKLFFTHAASAIKYFLKWGF
ncbi:glycosyltransferase family 2 protein [uncultured Polaribacter sp.]|uniref:glycosyltransferase family 2 protein n=1 Tax=uncultured Polaribacter sp. TaxID=174711 RepID=UPI0026064B60|nr:glycosyltransferase family 2 protein [uncultured Polaribacter sp.]